MKIKFYYLPLASTFLIAGIFLGIQITLLIQAFVPFPYAKSCAKIPNNEFAIFVPNSFILDRTNLMRVVESNRWAHNENCKLFKSKYDYVKKSEASHLEFAGASQDENTPVGYVKIPSKKYEIKSVWQGVLVGYFSQQEAQVVKQKIMESAYKKEPNYRKEPFIVNNINTNN
ncbi:MAG: hypothetical protein F6K31_17070 [Symploca sp. SIO2G7]|nr:hypothetical protein [Symploca sp. SIO2G7]